MNFFNGNIGPSITNNQNFHFLTKTERNVNNFNCRDEVFSNGMSVQNQSYSLNMPLNGLNISNLSVNGSNNNMQFINNAISDNSNATSVKVTLINIGENQFILLTPALPNEQIMDVNVDLSSQNHLGSNLDGNLQLLKPDFNSNSLINARSQNLLPPISAMSDKLNIRSELMNQLNHSGPFYSQTKYESIVDENSIVNDTDMKNFELESFTLHSNIGSDINKQDQENIDISSRDFSMNSNLMSCVDLENDNDIKPDIKSFADGWNESNLLIFRVFFSVLVMIEAQFLARDNNTYPWLRGNEL